MKKINLQKIKEKMSLRKVRNFCFSFMLSMSLMTPVAMAAEVAGEAGPSNSFDNVVAPIVSLLNQLMGPVLALVGALGGLYCVLLGVKFAKAEEPQEREKAKHSLKGAVIGFVLIFVLLLALNLSLPVLEEWVIDNQLQGNPIIL
ncbi:MAG: pilin [Bacillota bacterium]|nr:pilin [Bacillota bacterium]